MADVDAALSVPEFMHSTPAELSHSYQLIDIACEKASALQSALHAASRQCPELRKELALVNEAIKELAYQQEDLIHFRNHYLGEVTP